MASVLFMNSLVERVERVERVGTAVERIGTAVETAVELK